MRAPTTTDTHPTTTTRTADARSVVRAIGRQACGGRCLRVVLTDAIGSRSRTNRRAAAVGPSLVSVLPIALCASTPAMGGHSSVQPADYVGTELGPGVGGDFPPLSLRPTLGRAGWAGTGGDIR